MKYLSRYLCCALFLLASWQVCPSQSAPKPTQKPLNQPGQDANFQRYLTSGRISVVAFYANWCPSCRSWSPWLDVVNRFFPDMQVIFMDIGDWDTPISAQYEIESIPHFKIYDGNGSLIVEGDPAKNWLRQAILQRLQATERGTYRLENLPRSIRLNEAARTGTSRPRKGGGIAPRSEPAVVPSNGPQIVASGQLPSVAQVLDRYLEALGGTISVQKFQTHSAKGKVNISSLGRGSFAMHFKAPNKLITMIDIPDVGVMKQGFDGTTGWTHHSRNGVRVATEAELDTLKRNADFYSWLNLKSQYPQLRIMGVTKIGYREAYVIEGRPTSAHPEKLYFSKDTGLLIRWDLFQATAAGLIMAEVYLDDWTSVEGIKMPFTITQVFPRHSIVFSFDDVKHDVELDDVVFNKPRTK